jgi:hypothetical protein
MGEGGGGAATGEPWGACRRHGGGEKDATRVAAGNTTVQEPELITKGGRMEKRLETINKKSKGQERFNRVTEWQATENYERKLDERTGNQMRVEITEGAIMWSQGKKKKLLRGGQTLILQGRTATRTSTLTVQGDRALWLEIRGDPHLAERTSQEWEEYGQGTKRNGKHGRPEHNNNTGKKKRTRDNVEQ